MATTKKFNPNHLKNASCPKPTTNIRSTQTAAKRPNQRGKAKRPGPGTKPAASE